MTVYIKTPIPVTNYTKNPEAHHKITQVLQGFDNTQSKSFYSSAITAEAAARCCENV